MRINHNIAALNTHRQLGQANNANQNSMEKLSSGLRINNASDDAAGLAISEKMRGQIRGLEQAQTNAQDGISMIQTAEGALNETHSILQRMRELSVQASNDTATDDDRKEIQKEMNQLIDESDRIATDTEFNTKSLLDGDYANTALKMQIGANEGQTMDVNISDMQTSALGSVNGTSSVTSTASIQTDFATSDQDTDIKLDGTTTSDSGNSGDITSTMTITLDQDYGDAAGVVDAINQQIQGNAQYKDAVEAQLLDGGKISFVNKGEELITTADGDSGTLDSAESLNLTHGQIGNTMVTVNSLKVDDVDTASSGGVLTQGEAESAITVIDDAIKQVSAERSKLGAYQNRLDHTINNLGTSSENLTAAESRIRDVDMAKEMMNQTKQSILSQASQAMLAKANQQPQGVLQLLR